MSDRGPGGQDTGEAAERRRLQGLELELPERGTGVRAARRAAAAAAAAQAQRAPSRRGEPRRAAGSDVEQTERTEASPAAEPAVREGGHPSPSRRWMAVFASVLVGAGLLGSVLAYVGVETLRDSSAGRRVTSADPDEPGYEALLEPTPTMLVLHARDGLLQSAAVLSLGAGGQGGSVLLLPPSVEVGDDDGARLSVVYAYEGSEEALRAAGETVSGVGMQELVVLDDARWAELVAPVAPLMVENPDEFGDFPAGTVSLGAEDVTAWLTAEEDGETELGVLYRHEVFWQAWVEAIAAAGRPDAVPGELDSGLGRFVRGLASGPHRVETLPVTEGQDDAGNVLYQVDRDVLEGLITDLVPFPIGTATSPRTRVRLLDGTGDQAHVGELAPAVAAAGSSVVVVGNAEAFDYDTTEIRYHQPAQRAAAERLQRALGAGEVVEDVRPIDAFDVTIVLGTDT